MPKFIDFDNAVLKYYFNNQTWSQLGSNLYFGLSHSVTVSGAYSEPIYTGYARQPIARGSFIINQNIVKFSSDIVFGKIPTTNAFSGFIDYFVIFPKANQGNPMYFGKLPESIPAAAGVIPRLLASTSYIVEN